MDQGGFPRREENRLHRVAQMLTAALSTTCRQLRPAPFPIAAWIRLGHAGFVVPAAAAAYRARIVGR